VGRRPTPQQNWQASGTTGEGTKASHRAPAPIEARVLTSGFARPRPNYQSTSNSPRASMVVDTLRKIHRMRPDQKSPWHTTISRRGTGFIRFSFQRFQALLTLFSKSFSPFPHGTCLLSVSNQYLALDEIYHPLSAPVPRNVTRRVRTVRNGLQATDGILTLSDALFQETYACALAGDASQDYNSRAEPPISILSFSLFIRHYWGNPV
jgi:hypothetical protein